MYTSCFRGAVIVCAAVSCFAAVSRPVPPLRFEPLPSQNGTKSFVVRERGFSALVSAGGVHLARRRSAGDLGIQIAGANPAARPEPGTALPGEIRYYIGNDPSKWRSGIRASDSVTYRGVYTGIDVMYHASGQQLEYDFRLVPGADAGAIHLVFTGAGRVHLAPDGSVAATSGHILQRKPVAYQEIGGVRRPIAARAALAGTNRIAFVLGRYDHRRAVVIDPVLVYSTYLGGGDYDDANAAVQVDAAGNAYVAGWTVSTDFPVLPAASNVNHGGADDIFVSKFDPSGKLIFSSYFGGSGEDEAYAMAFDPSGNVLITGETESTNFPIYPSNAFQGIGKNNGDDTAFALKIDPNGKILASTFLGGSLQIPAGCSDLNEGYGIASDGAGNVYVTGETCATDFPLQSPIISSIQSSIQGSRTCFVTELNPSLTAAVYSTYLGGSQTDSCSGIAVDSAGNAYVTGGTTSGGLATAGAFQTSYGGGSAVGDELYGDAFIAKIKPAGAGLAYYTYLGGSVADEASGIAIDAAGDVYVAGWTQSRNFPVHNAFQAAFGGGQGELPSGDPAGDVFVAELDPSGGKLVYSSYFGSAALERAERVAVDSSGRLYVAGATNSKNLIATAGAVQSVFGGMQDAFLLTVAPAGTSVEYFSYLGGSGIDLAHGVAVSSSGNVYIAGQTQSSDFPLAQPFQKTLGGVQDAFVAMIGSPVTSGLEVNSVTNGASFGPAVAAGSLATIFAKTLVTNPTYASGNTLPGTLANVSVQVNGITAPLLYVDSKQINFQLPSGLQAGQAQVVVTSGSVSSASFPFTIGQAAPGIFVYGTNRAVAQNYPSYSLNTAANPVPAGGTVIVYLTGQGPVNNPVGDGVKAPGAPLSTATLPYSATVGGVNAPVTFLGLSPGFVGLSQADITIPQLSPGDYPLVVTIGGVASNSPVLSVH